MPAAVLQLWHVFTNYTAVSGLAFVSHCTSGLHQRPLMAGKTCPHMELTNAATSEKIRGIKKRRGRKKENKEEMRLCLVNRLGCSSF